MQPPQERVKRTSHRRALRRDLEMTARLGTVDTAAAEECATQIGRTAAFLADQLHIRTRAQHPRLEEAEAREERRDSLSCCDIDDVRAPSQLRRALHCDRGLDSCVHRTQETDHTARDGGTRRLKPQPEAVLPVRYHRRTHAQECGKLCRLTALTLSIRTRERILYIRGERRHLSSPENRRSCA